MTTAAKDGGERARAAAEARKARDAARLASALRENLRRRKEQARARLAPGSESPADEPE